MNESCEFAQMSKASFVGSMRRSLKAKSSRAPGRDAVSVQCSLSVRELLTLLSSMIAWLNDFHRVSKFLNTIELTNLSRNITSMRAILS